MSETKFYNGIKYKLYKNADNLYYGYVFVKKPFFKGDVIRIDKSKSLVLVSVKNYIDDFIKQHKNFKFEEKVNSMSFQEDKKIKNQLDLARDKAALELSEFLNTQPKGVMGLTPDEVKNSDKYKTLNYNYDLADKRFKDFITKTKFNTKYKKELLVERVSNPMTYDGKKNIYYDPKSKYFNPNVEESSTKLPTTSNLINLAKQISEAWHNAKVENVLVDSEFGNVTATINGNKNIDCGYITDYKLESSFKEVAGTKEDSFITKILKIKEKLYGYGYSRSAYLKPTGVELEFSPNNWSTTDRSVFDKYCKSAGIIGEMRPRFKNGDISHKTPPVMFFQYPTSGVFTGRIMDALESKGYKWLEVAKFKEIASEWFDALSSEQQKSYVKNHPNSKFAHKVGSGEHDSKKLYDKDLMVKHLQEENQDGKVMQAIGESLKSSDEIDNLKEQISKLDENVKLLNSKLDIKNLSEEMKDKIYDKLDSIKDKRKYLNNKLTDLK